MILPVLRPMLAVSGEPFSNQDFLFEVKWDGYRCLAYLEGGTVLRSRNVKDLTPTFPELADVHRCVRGLPALLDGEIVVLSGGLPDFDALQQRGRLERSEHVRAAAERLPALLIVFDILYHRGVSLLARPLRERKEILRAAVNPDRCLVVADYIRGDGEAYFTAAVGAGLEGVVAKRLDGPYLPGRRSPLWRKIRAVKNLDAVICGYEAGTAGRFLASLILGAYRGGKLIFVGHVGTGFTAAQADLLHRALEEVRTPDPPVQVPPGRLRRPRWVHPVLVCTVNYAALTRQGILRHPSFVGLRDDKKPEECVLPQ
ncbi:MAG: non-homologous end-joining DNA ligase [Bacillota bacterium]